MIKYNSSNEIYADDIKNAVIRAIAEIEEKLNVHFESKEWKTLYNVIEFEVSGYSGNPDYRPAALDKKVEVG